MSFRGKLIGFIAIIYFFSLYALHNLDSVMDNGDSAGYYIHLVSFFIYDDVGDYSRSTDKMIEIFPSSKGLIDDPFWLRKTDINKKYIKHTIGVSLMEAPSFFLAHLYAIFSKKYDPDGWSKPYIVAINISKVIYILIGLYFLIPILSKYFSQTSTALSIIGVAIGTNLFFHVPNLTMAHPFLFFDFCMLIYFSSRFYEQPSYFRGAMIGVFLGVIAITRVPEILALVIPVFWGLYNYQTAKKRVLFVAKNYRYILVALMFLIVVITPQLFYWHYVSGHFFFNPYEGEGFDFSSPDFQNAFFSFNNGWLIYTPLMCFSLLGILYLPKTAPKVILPLVLFVGLNSWVHFSYYVVNYFPGLGSRPMIESYPLLAFSLAAFFSYCEKWRVTRYFSIALLTLFVFLNIFQTIQSNRGVLFSENMNPTYYWEIFGRLKIDENSVKEFDSNENQPDLDDIEFQENLFFEDFEDSMSSHSSDLHAFSGKYSYLCSDQFPDLKYESQFSDHSFTIGDYISVSIYAYRKSEDYVSSLYDLERLVVELLDEDGKTRRKASIKIAKFIKNNGSIFHTGKPDIWGQAQFFIKIPSTSKDKWMLRIFIENPSENRLYLDNLSIDKYSLK
jgi:hypothetical protein